VKFFDGHNDVLTRLAENGAATFIAGTDRTQLDLRRCRAGGFAGGLFAIWMKSKAGVPIDHAEAEAFTHRIIDQADRLAGQGDQVRLVRSVGEIDQAMADDRLAIAPHIEGAEAIAPDLSNLDAFIERGVRSIRLVWSRPCAFGQGITGPGTADGEGLTDAGRALVRACNERRVLIDLSHLNDTGFRDVAAVSAAPLVASHSNARSLCDCPRNLTEDQIKVIAESGGIIGMNFCTSFLADDGKPETTTIGHIADHASYIADRVGVEHVALGSDFDGCEVPADLRDVTGMPKLFDALVLRGWSDADLAAFAWGNWRRVLLETWGQ